jgi:hypothetical protein
MTLPRRDFARADEWRYIRRGPKAEPILRSLDYLRWGKTHASLMQCRWVEDQRGKEMLTRYVAKEAVGLGKFCESVVGEMPEHLAP